MARRFPFLALFGLLAVLGCRARCDGPWLAAERLCVPVEPVAPTAAAGSPAEWADRADGGTVRAQVELTPRVDLERLGEVFRRRGTSRLERRRLAVAALERVAEEGRRALDPLLEELRAEGSLADVHLYAVVPRLRVEATPQALARLARRPEVVAVLPETTAAGTSWQRFAAAPDPSGPEADAAKLQPGPETVGAERAWAAGLDGSGVVVGILDSGASDRHEQLREGFRGGGDSWYDPAGGSPEPIDTAFGHGSGVLSVAVGRNVAGIPLGVAPGARWVACAGLPDGRLSNLLLTECADWMLRVARPDVLINAWLLPGEGCDPSLRPLVDAWRAAEILPVFAAGNHGPGRGSDRSPANYAGLYPGGGRSLAVGGLTAAGGVWPRSARGPGSCDGGTFPSLAAPAEGLMTALPLTASTYRRAEGTSYAAGLVAGAAALLLQRHPEASVGELEEALRRGAVDLGPSGPDDDFGWGRLDIPGALDHLARSRR